MSYYNDITLNMLPADGAARVVPVARTIRRRALACLFAAALGGLVYVNALHNPFVYDDFHTVAANSSLTRPADLRSLILHDATRPVINISYAVDRAVWGPGPFGFHLTNVLLHVLNVLLLFQLTCRLAADRGGRGEDNTEVTAFAAAALFAVHPMMTEAVGYISGRSEVLCGTLFLLGFLCARRWIRGDRGLAWPIFAVGFWFAALLAKEVAAMFPCLLLAYDRLVVRSTADQARRRLITIHLPLMGTALAGGILRLIVLSRIEHPGQISVHWSYALLDLDILRRYLGMLVMPGGQAIFHQINPVGGLLDPRALAGVGTLLALAVLAWRVRTLEPRATLGILWFLLLLVPSSVLILLDQGEPFTEHRVYLASCGLFLAVGTAAGWLFVKLQSFSRRSRIAVASAFVLILVSFAAQTLLRNLVWSDPVTLWRESVDLAPDHYRPRLLLGEALEDRGRLDEAIEQFQAVVRLRPEEPQGYMKLGIALAETKQFDAAQATFRALQRIDPASPIVEAGLATVSTMRGLVP